MTHEEIAEHVTRELCELIERLERYHPGHSITCSTKLERQDREFGSGYKKVLIVQVRRIQTFAAVEMQGHIKTYPTEYRKPVRS